MKIAYINNKVGNAPLTPTYRPGRVFSRAGTLLLVAKDDDGKVLVDIATGAVLPFDKDEDDVAIIGTFCVTYVGE